MAHLDFHVLASVQVNFKPKHLELAIEGQELFAVFRITEPQQIEEGFNTPRGVLSELDAAQDAVIVIETVQQS